MRSRLAVAAAAVLLAAGAARADVTVRSGFGYGGKFVPGTVTPVHLEVSSSEKAPITCRLEVLPPRSLGGVTASGVTYATTVFLAPGAKKRLTLPVLPRGILGDGDWTLRIQTDRRTLLRHGTRYEDGRLLQVLVGAAAEGQAPTVEEIDPGSPVIGLFGTGSQRLAFFGTPPTEEGSRLVRHPRFRGAGPSVVVTAGGPVAVPRTVAVDPEQAPDTWLCYEGFDAILWVDPDPDGLPEASQLEALLSWAAHGGRLVVAVTPGARIAAGSPLARALPASFAGHDEVPAGEALEALAGPLPRPWTGPRIPVARLQGVRGRVDAALPDGRPLLVSGPHGLGTVALLALDPRPFAAAPEESRFALLPLLAGPAMDGGNPETFNPATPRLEPLVAHLRKRFLTAPPLGLLVLGLILYVVAIGPFDYYYLKKRNKLRRTVVTFPLIVLGFTLLAYGGSFLLFGGTAGRVRVACLDFATAPDRDADVVRGLDIVGTYSPVGDTVEVAYEEGRSFVGAPWLGSGGSYYPTDADSAGIEAAIEYGPDGRPLATVEVPLRSHRTVQGRFSLEVPSTLDAVLREGPGGVRVLEVRNGLRCAVRDLVLVLDGRDHALGDLAKGETLTRTLGPSPGIDATLLPAPFGGFGGLFGGHQAQSRLTGVGADAFAPADDTPAAVEAARRAMARAVMGASLCSLPERAGGAQDLTRAGRVLARHGLDLSHPVREGRPLLLGWCEQDPLGVLPREGDFRSTVVVVRRLLPAPGEDTR